MEEFLKTVARHYYRKSIAEAQQRGEPESLPLSRYLFCFPNRRSSLFFARYLQEAFSDKRNGEKDFEVCCVPNITTIGELFRLFSTRQVIDRTALLFRLFEVYQRLSQRREAETFDQFVFWGDMLLADFDDVDKYLVNADQLYSNVRDLKEIDARFAGLTDEQIRIIQSFWSSFRPEVAFQTGDKREVFGQTWAILAELYHTFRRELRHNNYAYEGMMEREVVERIYGLASSDDNNVVETADGSDMLESLRFQKVVFVGLTAVSVVDRRLMSFLKLHGRAEFCWDYADPRLSPENSLATSAAYFTRSNLSDFGNELSEEELSKGLVAEKDRQVSLYATSSGVGQTQQARRVLQHWYKTLPDFDPLRTAVVLPDENLLLPMLYAIPAELGTFNVTMGYNLRLTPVSAFVGLLTDLQQSWREEAKCFYFRQVLPILSHSFTLGVSGDKARRISKEISEQNLYQVPIDMLNKDEFLGLVFRPLHDATETVCYLEEILSFLMERAAQVISAHEEPAFDEDGQFGLDFDSADNSRTQTQLFTDIDYEFFYHYRKTLLQLRMELLLHDFAFTPKTLYMLLDKLVSGVSVPFSGEPLKGLQLMGVLETRSLDFDNVLILSMNEGVFPAKPSQNSFIPMSLRDAFGMPTQRHRDSVFAYHFYRLIGRSRRLAMIYDSRTEGMQTGEESRYIKQLRFLMGHANLQTQTIADDIGVVSPAGIVVAKTPEIIESLKTCLGPDGTHNFSATVLKDYIICPLKFYLSFVRHLNEEDEVTEGIDASMFGDIFHQAMKSLYDSCEGRRVEASMLERYVKPPYREVNAAIAQAFDDVMHLGGRELEGYNLLVSQILVRYVVDVLRHDKELCPFEYLAGEIKQNFLFEVSDSLNVRIKCIYDRLDKPLVNNPNETIRIVDYKTGNSGNGAKLQFPLVEDFFTDKGKGSKEAFQVMLYSLLLENVSSSDVENMHLSRRPDSVVPHLYFVRDFHQGLSLDTTLRQGTGQQAQPISDFSPYREEFRERLIAMFQEIYNPEIPFTQGEDTKPCTWCQFAQLCKRN